MTETSRIEVPPALAPHEARTQLLRLSARAWLRNHATRPERALQLLILATILGFWEWFGRRADPLTFAPPTKIAAEFVDMTRSGELPRALGQSLLALSVGLALAVVVGIAVGYAMGWWTVVGRTLDPFVSALYVVPIVALVPAMIIWFGLGLTSRVLVVFLFGAFEILLNAYAGVKNVDPYILDVARTFGASRLDLLRKVVFPATLPFLFVGLRMGASRALKGMIVAEMLFAVTGLGRLIIVNAGAFKMSGVLVVALTVAAVGILLTAIIQSVERRVMRWRG
ncbi:MAG: ABC transporter permease [Actinobacteria bacterium]|nr:ABC transporter permease [Actinomycetota bacterium]